MKQITAALYEERVEGEEEEEEEKKSTLTHCVCVNTALPQASHCVRHLHIHMNTVNLTALPFVHILYSLFSSHPFSLHYVS